MAILRRIVQNIKRSCYFYNGGSNTSINILTHIHIYTDIYLYRYIHKTPTKYCYRDNINKPNKPGSIEGPPYM
jgi:hypothetical protein